MEESDPKYVPTTVVWTRAPESLCCHLLGQMPCWGVRDWGGSRPAIRSASESGMVFAGHMLCLVHDRDRIPHATSRGCRACCHLKSICPPNSPLEPVSRRLSQIDLSLRVQEVCLTTILSVFSLSLPHPLSTLTSGGSSGLKLCDPTTEPTHSLKDQCLPLV